MRERRAGLSWITLVILLLACITVQGVGIVEASPGPKVKVDPKISTAAPDEAFNVSITVTGITVGESLYGWEFTLSFDPSVLNITSHIEQVPIPIPPFYENVTVYHVYEGPFLKDIEDTIFISPEPNNTAGTVKALCTFKLPYPPQGAVSKGVLVTIEFRVKAEGATLLHFDYTELYTVIEEDITYPIAHEASDGFFEYPLGVHDIAVTNVTPSPVSVPLGENVSISVTVKNNGTATETFSVTVYYNLTATERAVIGTVNVTDLAPDGSKTLSFTWNTSGVTPGTFTIKVEVPPVSGETNTSDNTATTNVTVLFHDIAITSVTASHTQVKIGDLVTIKATVANEGDFHETFNVTACYFNETLSNVTIGTPQVLALDPGDSQLVAFTWDTTNVSLGTYTIKANATIPPGDTNTTNNELIDGTVNVAEFSIVHHTVEVGGVTFHVVIESNSTLSNIEFIYEDKKISFNVTGSEGTVGFCNVTIPNVLLGGPYTVQVDDLLITPEETTNGTHTFLYFTYNHSTQTVQIKGATVATPPTAFFTPSTTSAYVGDQITFNATASEDPDGEIASYQWDFGDGTPIVTETDPIATHEYTSAGTYPVTLTVTDNQGLTDTATGTATISAKHDVAVVEVTPFPSEVTVGKLVSITVTVVNGGTETETFNVIVYYDNTIIGTKSVTNLASGASQTLTINWKTTDIDPGTYTIKAVASTITGEIDITNNEFIDDTVTITVQEAPALGILLYVAAAGLAVTIIAAIAFYFLRIRKPKQA